MGADPVTTEPIMLKINEEIRSILEEAGLLSFFKNFLGHSDSITNHFVESWKDGRSSVNGLEFLISEALITEVLGLPNEGGGLGDEVSHSGREILEAIWISHSNLNSIRNKKKVNIPLFLLKSMEKSVKAVKVGKGKEPLHQGLMKMLTDFELHRKISMAGPTKGVFVRVNGALVFKAQLLLGPSLSSPLLILSDTMSDSDGNSGSLEGDCLTTNPKEKGGRKRKPPAQSLDEEHKFDDPGSLGGRSKTLKVTVAAPSEKGAKSFEGSHLLFEELCCHLRVLNGLDGSLTSTCACINILTLEITNYLKEVDL
eukprot:Gb_40947 [translate_table: standard]